MGTHRFYILIFGLLMTVLLWRSGLPSSAVSSTHASGKWLAAGAMPLVPARAAASLPTLVPTPTPTRRHILVPRPPITGNKLKPPPCNTYAADWISTDPRTTPRVPPGASFDITVYLRNGGDCTWDQGVVLTWVGKEKLSANPLNVSATGITPPETQAGFRLHLTAPAATGYHAGDWQLRSPNGPFGPNVELLIKVQCQGTTCTSTDGYPPG